MSRPVKKGIGVRTSVYFPVDLCLDMANAMAALGNPKLNSFIREAVQHYCDTVIEQDRMLKKEGAYHGEESKV